MARKKSAKAPAKKTATKAGRKKRAAPAAAEAPQGRRRIAGRLVPLAR